jgi:hypothetical protein
MGGGSAPCAFAKKLAFAQRKPAILTISKQLDNYKQFSVKTTQHILVVILNTEIFSVQNKQNTSVKLSIKFKGEYLYWVVEKVKLQIVSNVLEFSQILLSGTKIELRDKTITPLVQVVLEVFLNSRKINKTSGI